ncbi:acyl-CoA dehydrogenase [Nitrospirillum viridazoti Y2]|uniref:3-hydroxy-9,10-secoandrosta-1,3,5(10)-triene-9, 17-dione monooxygenase n=1 Tax=Nitrospirillum amazonense TaxID=28077 RepID=A0A560J573_9PROT|nr:acyl-CoA dehydrogenase family protein [Nitrospirillum amazonense]EGY02381.1 acyl-CoA dehydrogenase [Nitrospirillum amazonense Y2]TWB64384.1 3-hydroxy-9,10-secoandrosta-1,3,5(10)-triene-9,17-dione monooxygenase [Nitrospirillum amazonense]
MQTEEARASSAYTQAPRSGQVANDASDLAAGLLRRAEDLIPALRSRSRVAIEAGQIPAETIQDFADAGFFKVLQPARYGGYQLPPQVYCAIARTLAEGCMSSAWVYAVIAVHNWQLALFDDRAAQEVWGGDQAVRISSSYMPVGKVTVVPGGYRLSGRWAFSSGSAHCDWVILGAMVPSAEPGGRPDPRNFLIPRSDYRIVENWDVMGLRATGSNDIVVDDAFVPEHRTIRELDMFNMNCPGHASNTAALYKMPFAQIFNRTVSTTSLGALKRALDVFVETTKEKRATYTGDRLARDTTIQYAVAQVERALDELSLVLDRDCRELMERAIGGDWPVERRAALGASTTGMVDRCVGAIDTLMAFSGAKAVFRGNPVQQAFLDIHTARAHVANNPYPYARNLGAVRFGFDNDSLDI